MRSILLILIGGFICGSSVFAANCSEILSGGLGPRGGNLSPRFPSSKPRPMHIYAAMLPKRFLDAIHSGRWVDVGGGYGNAALEISLNNRSANATVINGRGIWNAIMVLNPLSDNARNVLIALGKKSGVSMDGIVNVVDGRPHFYPDWHGKLLMRLDELPKKMKVIREVLEVYNSDSHLIELALSLGISMDGIVKGDIDPPLYFEGWKSKLIGKIAGRYFEAVGSGRFDYRVGDAQEVLPQLKPFGTLSDVSGSYLHSNNRPHLLEIYYDALAVGGEAYIVFEVTDYFLNSNNGWQWQTFTYGSTHMVKSAADRRRYIPLEQALVVRYPNIFSIENAGRPYDVKTQVLVMKRDPNVQTLNLGVR